jgi:hypothetical protein
MRVTGRVIADEEIGVEMAGPTGRRITTALESRFTVPSAGRHATAARLAA